MIKRYLSYMVCVVGLVLVLCGSASAAGLLPSDDYMGLPYISIQHSDGSSFCLSPSEISLHSLEAPVYFFAIPRVSGGALNSYNLNSAIIRQYEGITYLGSTSGYNTMYGLSIACSPGDIVTVSMMRRALWSDSDISTLLLSGRLYVVTGGTLVSPSDSVLFPYFTLSSSQFPSATGSISNRMTTSYTTGSFFNRSLTFSFQVPETETSSYLWLYDYDTFYSTSHYGCNWLTPDSSVAAPPPDWIAQLPDFALEVTQKSILSKLDTPLTSIVTAINNLSAAVGQESPMDKFESNYIQNFDNQLTKTEEYLGSDSPVIPGNFVTPGDDGSPSMVDSLKDGMGLSNSSFDSQAFQDASQAFSGPDSTSEGGMWWFFTQEIADALEVANPNSREDNSLDAWIADGDRRWSMWGW